MKMASAVTPFVLFVSLPSNILSQPTVTDEPAFSRGNPSFPQTAATSPLLVRPPHGHGLPGWSGRQQSAHFVQRIRQHGAEDAAEQQALTTTFRICVLIRPDHLPVFLCLLPIFPCSLLRWRVWESCVSRESLLLTSAVWVTFFLPDDKFHSSLAGQFLLRTLNHKLGTLNTRAREHGNLAPRLAA